jgi:protein-S-isoprenylcysteine O-methyltransferase Ste14
MSLRDLLSFNLFLQFTDGLISYQAFALGAIEANPVVAAAIVNWGMGWGLIYNKALACLLLLLIFALRHNRRLLALRGLSVTASVYVCAIGVCLWQLLR